jgi:hypothetical protein
MRTLKVTTSLLLGLIGVSACHGNADAIAVTGPDAAFQRDAGEAGDASTPTGDAGGSRSDAGNDGAIADEDAGANPGLLDPMRACSVASENSTLELEAASGDEGGFSLTPGLTGFGVAYHAPGCGVIGALPVAALGPFVEPKILLGDACASLQDVAFLHVTNGWRLAWVDNAAGSAELQTLSLSSGMLAPMDALPVQITKNGLREYKPVLAEIAGVAQAAWIAMDPATGKRQIDRKRLDDQDSVETVLSADSGHNPLTLAFAQLGRDRSAIAFVDETGARGIWLSRFDKASASIGSPVLVNDLASTSGSVDLATREEDGGAIIYSINIENVNNEVRFRRLDNTGALLGTEVKIVGRPLQGRDASLARIGGGYVVAYRQLSSDDATKSEVRLTFITKEGNVTRDSVGRLVTYPVADASSGGGRVTVRVSTDGQLLVGFLDRAGTASKLRLVRKRLDCAL